MFTMDVDLVLLAMGFLGPVRSGMIEELGVAVDARGNVATTDYKTSVDGIFAETSVLGLLPRDHAMLILELAAPAHTAFAFHDI